MTPTLTDLADRVRQRLARTTPHTLTPTTVADAVRECTHGLIGHTDMLTTLTELHSEFVGAGPLDPLLHTPDITDILVTAPNQVWTDSPAGLHQTKITFPDDTAVRRLAQRLALTAGRRLDDAQPFVDAWLPDTLPLSTTAFTPPPPQPIPPTRTHPTQPPQTHAAQSPLNDATEPNQPLLASPSAAPNAHADRPTKLAPNHAQHSTPTQHPTAPAAGSATNRPNQASGSAVDRLAQASGPSRAPTITHFPRPVTHPTSTSHRDSNTRPRVRMHAVLPPIATSTYLSLRILRPATHTLPDLVRRGTFTQRTADLLTAIVEARLAFLVSGGTGSGKTTLLSALLTTVSPDERIVCIEDAGELHPDHPQFVRLLSRPPNIEGAGEITQRDLVRQSLRMRPDRIVVGEVRGPELIDLLTALNTGHDGGAGTVHANTPTEVPARLEALAALAGMPHQALHSQLAAAVHLVLHMTRTGPRRTLTEIALLHRPSDTVQAIPVWRDNTPTRHFPHLARLLHKGHGPVDHIAPPAKDRHS
ncbi:hypothetical protein GCM10023148_22140 [Actinokineospora soli]